MKSPLAFILLLAAPACALADPCKAIPDSGPAPKFLSPGKVFSGHVTYVGDGDSLCVAIGPGPQNLVEVRIADFYAPEMSSPEGPSAKRALGRIAKGRQVTCIAGRQSYDRVVATCRLKGASLGDLMRKAGVKEGGNGR